MYEKQTLSKLVKTTLLIIFVAFCTASFSQEQKKGRKKGYVNLGFQGLETSVNLKLDNDFYLELFAGIGGGIHIWETSGYAFNFDFILLQRLR